MMMMMETSCSSLLPILIRYPLSVRVCLQDELATDSLIDITIEHAMINHRDGFLIRREDSFSPFGRPMGETFLAETGVDVVFLDLSSVVLH